MTGQTLPEIIQQARGQAKAILTALEGAGHPQTNESSSLYLGLVTVQKRLAAQATGATGEVAADLEQLARLCVGKLEGLKPLLEEAARLARGRPR
jgi:predicted transcriptional regulator with HTH domain